LVELFEKAALVQARTGVPLQVPAEISPDDVEVVYYAAERIETGVVHGIAHEVGAEFHRDSAEHILRHFDAGTSEKITLTQGESVRIFGAIVPLGVSVTEIHGLHLTPSEASRLRVALAADPNAAVYPATLSSPPNNKVVRRYVAWLPAEEREKIPPEWLTAEYARKLRGLGEIAIPGRDPGADGDGRSPGAQMDDDAPPEESEA
jgi:hypothetical protein